MSTDMWEQTRSVIERDFCSSIYSFKRFTTIPKQVPSCAEEMSVRDSFKMEKLQLGLLKFLIKNLLAPLSLAEQFGGMFKIITIHAV